MKEEDYCVVGSCCDVVVVVVVDIAAGGLVVAGGLGGLNTHLQVMVVAAVACTLAVQEEQQPHLGTRSCWRHLGCRHEVGNQCHCSGHQVSRDIASRFAVTGWWCG